MTPWQRYCWWMAALCGLLALISVTEANIAGSLFAAVVWGSLGKLRLSPCIRRDPMPH